MNKQIISLNTPEGRSSFVHIFTPTKRYNPTNDPAKDENSYEMELLFDKNTANLEALTGAINQAIANQWPQGMPPGVMNPIRDGDLATTSQSDPTLKCVKFPEYVGKYFVKIKSPKPVKVYRQTIVGQDGQPLPAVEITSDQEFFAGCNCIANVNVAAYSVGPSVGVNLYFNAIMMTTPGERLGGGGCDPSVFPALPAGSVPPAPAGPATATGGFPQQQVAPQQQTAPQGAYQAPPAQQPQQPGVQPVQQGALAQQQPVQQGQQFPPPAPGTTVPQR